MHVRRVVWRYGRTNEKWRVFGFRTVSFGDKPAGVFLDIVIKRVARMHNDVDPQAARKIAEDRYVDDITTGGSEKEVSKMIGDPVCGDKKFERNGTLTQILSHGSLRLKAIVRSGETDTEIIDKVGGSALGTIWNPTTDIIFINLRLSDYVDKLINSVDVNNISLTRRIILGIINKPHDLLGLISPITIRLMASYRDLFRAEPCLDWDEELPQKLKVEWINMFRMLIEVANVSFPRATRPKSAIKGPEIIGYFDGSDNAYAAVVYLRWVLSDGSIHATLAGSKAKVTPLKWYLYSALQVE